MPRRPCRSGQFEAIGAPWRIDTPDELSDSQRDAVAERIEAFDRDWSRFRDDSLVSRISREPGRHRLPADAGPLMDWYRELYDATGGRVSPLVGRTLESLGYDASYRLTPAAERVAVPAWADAMAWDGEYLDTARPVLLDVGAAGKGYLVDLISELLVGLGVVDSRRRRQRRPPRARRRRPSGSRSSIPPTPRRRSESSRCATARCARAPPTGAPGATASTT